MSSYMETIYLNKEGGIKMKGDIEEGEVITGRLENWYRQQVTEGEFVLWGDCYDDVHERWKNGARIHTSGIKNGPPLKSGDVVKTRNSLYLLGKELTRSSPIDTRVTSCG